MRTSTIKLCEEREAFRRAGELPRFRQFVTEAFDAGEFKLEDIRLRPLFARLVPGGAAALEAIDDGNYTGALRVVESDAVQTSDFHHILLRALSSKVKEQYDLVPNQLSPLFRTIPTVLETERIPGIGGLGDGAEIVEEGQYYPMLKPGADYVDTPTTKKRGFIVPVTKEAIFFDRTGQLVNACQKTAQWLAINKEKRCWSLLAGVDNTYNYMGTNYDTYYTSGESGPWINSHTNAWNNNWSKIDNAMQLQVAMRDPMTNEPIEIAGTRWLIGPPALEAQFNYFLSSTEHRKTIGDLTSDGDQVVGRNPFSNFRTLNSVRLKDITGNDTTWFYGDPSMAFGYMENWGITTDSRGAGTEDEFLRDISLQFKVSERGTTAVLEPRFMVENTG